MKVLIVGGVAGGASAAARLRRLDESAEIIMFERGPYISYANCGLPYYVGGVIPHRDDLLLQTPESFYARTAVEVRVNTEVTAINRAAKTVTAREAGGREYTESYDCLLLAPGAQPFVPPLPGADLPGIFTVKDVPDALAIKSYVGEHRAKSALVVGGGYIGVEMAENLHDLGLRVTLCELSDQVIAPLDFDMAQELHVHMRHKGIDLRLKTGLTALAASDGRLAAALSDGRELPVDVVILSVGMRPASGLASAAGLETDTRGFILTDSHMRTSDPAIYAAGDAVAVRILGTDEVGSVALAGPANRQGRIAADNMAGISSEFSPVQGSAIIKCFDMTAASTGLNEKTARRLDIPYEKVYTFSASHATYYPGASFMSLKLLYTPGTGRLLGAQVVGGEGADKRCDVLATAIRADLTVEDLCELELCYAPPYTSAKDPVNMAGFVAQNIRAGLIKPYYWNEVAGLDWGTVTILDVRTAGETASGTIEGAVCIPVDELRGRLGELDKTKPVYVNCYSGQRSYTACRILSQQGFDCYNLLGGYRLYTVATAKI